MRSRWNLRAAIGVAVVALAAICFVGATCAASGSGEAPVATTNKILVLYDETGPFAWLGQMYAVGAMAVASHFAAVEARPVRQYREGTIKRVRGIIYIGSTFDEPLPREFLDDVARGERPVVWVSYNIWQLVHRVPGFARRFGFSPATLDMSPVFAVQYKGALLQRDARNDCGIMTYEALTPATVQVAAVALRRDGTTTPWAIRARNLFYIGDNPFAFIGPNDRYLAFCDLLFDAFASDTAERHRALVRIEDVHPKSSPERLRAITDLLARQHVPFSVAVVPEYVDAKGVFSHGVPTRVRLQDAPELVAALRHAVTHGGTLILHGYTHQYGDVSNPYSGVSAADFEFFATHLDNRGTVVLDGPVGDDSAAWAGERIDRALRAFDAAGLARPTIFEYPHYAGSVIDSRTIAARLRVAYQRGLYFGGMLGTTKPDYSRSIGLFFPFVVHDIYGWKVIPENLGNYVPGGAQSNEGPRLAADLLTTAGLNRVVRDGVVSFFFHPMYDPAILEEIVRGVKSLGYTFVSPGEM